MAAVPLIIGALTYGSLAWGLIMYGIVVHMVQRHRPSSRKDGLLVLSSWPSSWRMLVSFCVVLFCLTPLLVYLSCHVGSAPLALAEGWQYGSSFQYVIDNVIGIGPLTKLSPATFLGKAIDLFMCFFFYTLTNIIIGISANLSIVSAVAASVPGSKFGLLLLTCTVPFLLGMVVFVFAIPLAVMEDADMGAVFVYVAALIIGIQNPLTTFVPRSLASNFILAWESCCMICLGGILLGVLGSHPQIVKLLTLLEGHPEEEEQEKSQESPEEISSQLAAQSSSITEPSSLCIQDQVCANSQEHNSEALVSELRHELSQAKQDAESLQTRLIELERQLLEYRTLFIVRGLR